MKELHIEELMTQVNHGEFRKSSIPMELAAGWPCIRRIGKTLCMTIPYFSRKLGDLDEKEAKIALYPLYCSVTVPLGNPKRIVDFTIYPNQTDWEDVDYTKPCGYFKHEALANVTRSKYQEMCSELFACYDNMIACIQAEVPFEKENEMVEMLSKLMEPGHFEQYLKINKKFYSHFCRL